MTLIFVVGPHGAGKSTLIQKIKSEFNFTSILEGIKIDIPINYLAFDRGILRSSKYYLECKRFHEIDKNNASHVHIVDRCIYDCIIYAKTYRELNWISQKELTKLTSLINCLFDDIDLPKNIILLCPDFDIIQDRLKKRWEKDNAKWQENDYFFLELLIKNYHEYFTSFNHNILFLEDSGITPCMSKVHNFIDKLSQNNSL